jgi:ketosteroid isomerase-like protein
MTATTTDYDEIVRVVQLYVDGFNDGDINKFKEAFHENAWIFFTDAEGALHKALLTDCFEDWAAPPHPEIVGRFISVNQAGDIASVLLGFDAPANMSGSWVDFHSLLRIDGIWKITNKTATHCSRAAWARAESSQRQDASGSQAAAEGGGART